MTPSPPKSDRLTTPSSQTPQDPQTSSSSSSQQHQAQGNNKARENELVRAFKCQRILALPSGERAKIESMIAYSDKILIGLSNGTLLVYTIDDPLSSKPKISLLKALKQFSNRSIEQIGILKDASSLVILSDNVVSVYDLETFTLDETLSKTKGATTFAITFGVQHEKNSSSSEGPNDNPNIDDQSSRGNSESSTENSTLLTTITRLVVGCKRRLICYEWKDSEFTEYKEINMPDRIKSISFLHPNKAVCGLNSDYCIVDIPQSEISSIALPGSHSHSSFTSVGISYIGIGGRSPFPYSTSLPDRTTLLVKDTSSQFVNEEGQLLERPQISWSSPPEGLGYSYPYLICILPKQVEIRNPTTTTLLQTIDIAGVRAIHCGKFTCVATQNQIYRLQGTDLKKQVQTLADKHLLTEAISILESVDTAFIDNKPTLLRDFNILKATDMLKNKEFETSLALFSSVSAPPDTVVKLFPSQISGSGNDLIKYTDSILPTRNLHQRTLSSLSSKSSRAAKGKRKEGNVGRLARADTDTASINSNSASSPAPPLKRSPTPNSTSSNSPSPVSPTSPISDSLPQQAETPSSTSPQQASFPTSLNNWTDKEFAIAIRSLVNFLADTRRKISLLTATDEPIENNGVTLTKTIFGDLGKAADLVDTTMFKCYFVQSPALIGPLLRIHNHCDPDTVKAVLSHSGKWRELIDFYFGKKLHHEALVLLKTLATGNTGTQNKRISTPEYLKGPEPTVQYLQRLNNDYIDLIFEFAKWPIQLNGSFGEDIFLEDSTESESLDRAKVLKYLEGTSQSLTIKYLEHVIFEKNEGHQFFHTSLAISYIKELSAVAVEASSVAAAVEEIRNGNTSSSSTKSTITEPSSKTAENVDRIFEKIVSFLKDKNSKYRLPKVLASLPLKSSECIPQQLEIKAILNGKNGDSKAALMIYTFDLKDDSKARAFCSEVYEEDKVAGRNALHTLMALYLTPPSDPEHKNIPQRLDLALDLLATQGSRMSVVDIINTLPPNTKINDISVFLTSQIRTLRTSWNNTQIDTALRKVNLVKSQEMLLNQQQRSITITNLKTCRVCFKRLGHSVISVFPDNTAIHYGCTRAYQQILDDERSKLELQRNRKSLESRRALNQINSSSASHKASIVNLNSQQQQSLKSLASSNSSTLSSTFSPP